MGRQRSDGSIYILSHLVHTRPCSDADRDVLDVDKKIKEGLVKLFRIFIDNVLDPLVEIYGMKKERIRLLWDESCQELAAFSL